MIQEETVDLSLELFMDEAISLAEESLKNEEVPVGAIVLNQEGLIIGRGKNMIEKNKSQTCHAEVEAIAEANKNVGGWRLDGCTILITLEPCLMCFGLIRMSRINKIVYGAPSPLFGYTNYIDTNRSSVICGLDIKSGLKQDASIGMLKEFFRKARLRERKKL